MAIRIKLLLLFILAQPAFPQMHIPPQERYSLLMLTCPYLTLESALMEFRKKHTSYWFNRIDSVIYPKPDTIRFPVPILTVKDPPSITHYFDREKRLFGAEVFLVWDCGLKCSNHCSPPNRKVHRSTFIWSADQASAEIAAQKNNLAGKLFFASFAPLLKITNELVKKLGIGHKLTIFYEGSNYPAAGENPEARALVTEISDFFRRNSYAVFTVHINDFTRLFSPNEKDWLKNFGLPVFVFVNDNPSAPDLFYRLYWVGIPIVSVGKSVDGQRITPRTASPTLGPLVHLGFDENIISNEILDGLFDEKRKDRSPLIVIDATKISINREAADKLKLEMKGF